MSSPYRGVVVPMMCGVEQEFGITTLDKLSAVPGFKSHMTIQHFQDQLARVGGAIAERSPELAPADKIFYDLRLETGTMYRALRRLVEAGLVRPTDRRQPAPEDDERRRYYAITAEGRRAAEQEALRLSRLVAAARSARLLPLGT